METDIKFQNISNLTTITTTLTGGYETSTIIPNNEWKTILSYTIPLSCVAIIVVILIVIGIRQRRRVLDKWSSLKRMKNTNPKFRKRVGLRRDSEFDSYNHADIKSVTSSQEYSQEYSLSTVS